MPPATVFIPGKNLGAFGDAGAVTTNDARTGGARAHAAQLWVPRKNITTRCKGYNSRLDELQAAFLRVKLKKLDEWNERRRMVAPRYLAELNGASGLTLPFVPEWAEPVWHLFVVRHPRRDDLQERLAEAGIGTLIHYPVPPHLSGAYAEAGWTRGDISHRRRMADTVLSLPMGPHLSPEQAGHVVEETRRSLRLFKTGSIVPVTT